MNTTLKLIFGIICFAFVMKAQANVIGSDASNFNAITSGLDFVTVQSSETLEPGIFNFGFFVNYAVNTLPYFPAQGGGSNQSRTDFNDYFLAGDYNLGLGLAPNWDVGVSFPVLFDSAVDNTDGLGVYSDGLMEIRLNTKYRFFGDASHGLAMIATVNFNRIQNNPFSGTDAGPTFNLELAGDKTVGRWALGGNIGYRFRDQGAPVTTVNIDPVPDQYVASAAASYLLEQVDTKVIFEIFTSFPTEDTQFATDRELSSAEFLAGVKHDYNHRLALHAGGGTELFNGASSPDWRIYAGLNWTTGPHWRKKEENVKVVERERYREIVIRDFHFKFGKAELVEKSKRLVGEMIDLLKSVNRKRKINRIVIEGHTDSVGSEAYNQQLSENRAKHIRAKILEGWKFDGKKIEAIGYGETQPIADNGNFQGRARNRRVEIKIY